MQVRPSSSSVSLLVPVVVAPCVLAAGVLAGLRTPALQPCVPVEQSTELEDLLKAVAEHTIEGGVGLSVVLAVDGETVFSGGWNRDAQGDPASPESAFAAPALAAYLVGLRAAEAAARGALDVDEPFASFFEEPESELFRAEAFAQLTLRRLLEHTSGLADVETFLAAEPRATESAFWTWLAGQPLEAEPGDCFTWRATNVLGVEHALERSQETSLRAWFDAALAEPLGLEVTRVGEGESPAAERPGGNVREASAEGGSADRRPSLPTCETSAAELAELLGAIASGTALPGAFELALAPVALNDGEPSPRGWEFERGSLTTHPFARASGSGKGSAFTATHYPELALTIAVVLSDEDAEARAVERAFARAYLGLSMPEISDHVLDPARLELYRGGYYIGCTRIAVEPSEDRLRALWPEGRSLELCYQGDDEFVACDDAGIRVTFVLEGERAVAFVLDEHGVRATAQRVD